MQDKTLQPRELQIAVAEATPQLAFSVRRGKSCSRFGRFGVAMSLRWLIILGFIGNLVGCSVLPQFDRQPQVHNPFPQLSKVAVAPFFNLSTEATLDGRKVALAYFNELQSVPGFEVVPVGVVETAIRERHLDLRGPEDARKLAQILKVDAVVIGAVTDYSPYYPPRITMQVEWYAANPGYHPIPPGYGLPWGTPDEGDIPAPLVFEAEMALAKAQLKTQTPTTPIDGQTSAAKDAGARQASFTTSAEPKKESSDGRSKEQLANASQTIDGRQSSQNGQASGETVTNAQASLSGASLPANWPDPHGFIPPGPQATPPMSVPSNAPVLRHTKTYIANDGDFTTALESYYKFRDDSRMGGWQSYLQRTDDFIRFSCHMHISEMLTARGGAGESRLVVRWPKLR